MAVTKMQKWIILIEDQYKEALLETIQECQAFEPIDEKVTLPSCHHEDKDEVIYQRIQSKEQQLKDILLAQEVLKPYVSKKRLKQRFSLTMTQMNEQLAQGKTRQVLEKVLALAKQNKQLTQQLGHLADQEQVLTRWKTLPILPKTIKSLVALHAFVGTFPQAKSEERYHCLQQHEAVMIEELFSDELERGVMVYCDKKDKELLEQELAHLHFTPFHYSFQQLPKEALAEVAKEKCALLEQRQIIVNTLQQLASHYDDLVFQEENTVNEIARLKAQLLMLRSHSVSAVVGWMSEQSELALKQLIQTNLPPLVCVCLKDTNAVDDKEVPIILQNHPLVEPFELLTEMYSLPKYSEVDPTPLLAPFYAVFFGMMVADIGYGLLMLLGTWYALKHMSLTKGMRKNLKLFHLLAYPSILWGIFFGSFFSIELPFKILSTATDAISILAISVVFGVIQLVFGLAINTHIQIKSRQYATAFSDGLGWIGIFIGIILIVLNMVLHTDWLNQLAQYIIIANVIGIVLSSMLASKNKLAGFGSGLYKLYGASSYIGDLASYTRLMALCVAGASIGSSFNLIIGLLPPLAKFTIGIVLFIVLQGLNLALALLGAYVHGIRLQFVEFFGKFYEGGGRQLKPLKTYEKYIDLKERTLEEK